MSNEQFKEQIKSRKLSISHGQPDSIWESKRSFSILNLDSGYLKLSHFPLLMTLKHFYNNGGTASIILNGDNINNVTLRYLNNMFPLNGIYGSNLSVEKINLKTRKQVLGSFLLSTVDKDISIGDLVFSDDYYNMPLNELLEKVGLYQMALINCSHKTLSSDLLIGRKDMLPIMYLINEKEKVNGFIEVDDITPNLPALGDVEFTGKIEDEYIMISNIDITNAILLAAKITDATPNELGFAKVSYMGGDNTIWNRLLAYKVIKQIYGETEARRLDLKYSNIKEGKRPASRHDG